MDSVEQNEKIAHFLSITDSEDGEFARTMLAANGWEVDAALNAFFAGETQEAHAPHVANHQDLDQGAHAFGDPYSRDYGGPIAQDLVWQDELDANDPSLEMLRNLQLQDTYGLSIPGLSAPRSVPGFSMPTPEDHDFGDTYDSSAIGHEELRRALALSAATRREEDQQEQFIRSTAFPQQGPIEPRAIDAVAGGGGTGVTDDDDEAFMEAAIMASLEQAQPAETDEDDPLFAQALKASLEPSAPGATHRFPNLRAQQAAEDRAAATAAMASVGFGMLHDHGMYDFADEDAVPFVPRPPSENTLQDRRLRQDQDQAYAQSLAADRAKETQRLEAERLKRTEEARAEEAARAQQAAQERAGQEARALLEAKRRMVPPEPTAAGPATVVVVVRLPDGSRLPPRRFACEDRVAGLHAFVDVTRADRALGEGAAAESLPALWADYELITTMPARALTDGGQTLLEAGISGQVLLNLHAKQ